jgi:exopolysaccharide biosynthesis polyprenyl glycosylphosphotransferase
MSASAYLRSAFAAPARERNLPRFAAPVRNRRRLMLADAAVPISVLSGSYLIHNAWLFSTSLTAFFELSLTLKNLLLLALTVGCWWGIFQIFGLYDFERIRNRRSEMAAVALASAVCSALSLVLWPVMLPHPHSVKSTLSAWYGTLIVALAVRYSLRLYEVKISPHLRERRNILIVGTGPRAQQLYQEAAQERSWSVLGFVDAVGGYRCPPDLESMFLGPLEKLERILMRQVVDEVLIALPILSCYAQIQDVITVCEKVGVEVRYFPHVFQSCLARQKYDPDPKAPAVVLKMVNHHAGCKFLKRVMDVVGAAAGLLMLSPILALVALAITLTSPGPILFAQERYGLHKRRFRMLKFRTMCRNAENLQSSVEHMNEAAGPIFKIRDDPRVTRLGKLLRKTSLDELPQLYNVLRGEMSLVGPRPMSIRDVALFSEAWLMRRFSVKPGITGLWQVSGRSNVSFDKWMELDLKYIDGWSLWLDVEILLKTLPIVVRGTGAQ